MESRLSTPSSSSSSSSSSTPPASASVIAWFEALTNNNVKAVKKLIAAGIDIHAYDDNEEDAMHHAIKNINHEMVQLLLVKGFDLKRKPKIDLTRLSESMTTGPLTSQTLQFFATDNSSSSSSSENTPAELSTDKVGYLEFLLTSIGNKICASQIDGMKFLPEKIIPVAEKILDTLLCYGLKIDEPWSQNFQQGINEIKVAANYQDSARERYMAHAEGLQTAKQQMPSNTAGEKVKKVFVGGFLYLYGSVRKKQATEKAKDTLIDDFLRCVYGIKPKLYSAQEGIAKQKKEKKTSYIYQTEMHRFFTELNLIDIVLDYSGNIEQDVAEDRLKNQAGVKIWSK